MQRSKLALWAGAVALSAAAFSPLANGQGGELGFLGGGSIYTRKSTPAQAKVGFENGFSAGAWGGHDMYQRLGGEIRYLFEQNKLHVSSGSGKASFSGRSHAAHYDLLFYGSSPEATIRPFFAVGGGIKGYQGSGEETPDQPLQNVALLTKTTQWKGLVVFGGGLKVAVGAKVRLRLDIYDYLTPFPTDVIAPAPGVEFGGWIHNLVPTFGISFVF
ncbi:MAG: hypothetical protein KIT09_14940 [Bryobacteraceae bacterium]|nr:hypothetical protein [Bryobacteraceae bacterium]